VTPSAALRRQLRWGMELLVVQTKENKAVISNIGYTASQSVGFRNQRWAHKEVLAQSSGPSEKKWVWQV
jgi:hypothetical protein